MTLPCPGAAVQKGKKAGTRTASKPCTIFYTILYYTNANTNTNTHTDTNTMLCYYYRTLLSGGHGETDLWQITILEQIQYQLDYIRNTNLLNVWGWGS